MTLREQCSRMDIGCTELYEKTKRIRKKRRAEGKCAVCCKPSIRFRCDACREKVLARWRALRNKTTTQCHRCRRLLPEHRKREGFVTCGWCEQDSNLRRW